MDERTGRELPARHIDHRVPLVPPVIRDLAEYAALFTAPGGWRDLRPLLYAQWDGERERAR